MGMDMQCGMDMGIWECGYVYGNVVRVWIWEFMYGYGYMGRYIARCIWIWVGMCIWVKVCMCRCVWVCVSDDFYLQVCVYGAYFVQCRVYSIYCTVYIVQCILYSV